MAVKAPLSGPWAVDCPACGAKAGTTCRVVTKRRDGERLIGAAMPTVHRDRMAESRTAGVPVQTEPLGAWAVDCPVCGAERGTACHYVTAAGRARKSGRSAPSGPMRTAHHDRQRAARQARRAQAPGAQTRRSGPARLPLVGPWAVHCPVCLVEPGVACVYVANDGSSFKPEGALGSPMKMAHGERREAASGATEQLKRIRASVRRGLEREQRERKVASNWALVVAAEREFDRREREQLGRWLAEHGDILL